MKKMFIVLMSLLLLLAACSSAPTPAPAQPVQETDGVINSGSDAVVSGTTPGNSDKTTTTPTTHEVHIKSFKFVPSDITVSAGDTVVWINDDSAPHTATANNGEFNSDRLEQEDQFSFTFDKQGDFSYFCEFHGGMKGNVKVE